VRKKFRDDLGSDEAKAYASDINQKWNVLVTRFGLRDMFNVLTELGIDFHDYHAGNMMLREDGTLVLIDLGMSKVKSPGKIDTISERKLTENHLKKIIKEELARLDARERSNVWRRISDTRTARRSLTVGC
jgi:predicted unusual protein kinase regulating ubiquinone biosynthesis (AarF/ABC1/UbiB family)